jgi:hypothetical protein
VKRKKKMNKKKAFAVIAVLLVALVSMSSIIYASQEGNDNVKSDLTAVQSTSETQQEDAEAEEKVRYMFVQSAVTESASPSSSIRGVWNASGLVKGSGVLRGERRQHEEVRLSRWKGRRTCTSRKPLRSRTGGNVSWAGAHAAVPRWLQLLARESTECRD